jgi:hypothetical protein
MIILYLVLVEIGMLLFYRHLPSGRALATAVPHERARHRASRGSVRKLVQDHRRRPPNPDLLTRAASLTLRCCREPELRPD